MSGFDTRDEGRVSVQTQDDDDWAWRRRIRSNPHAHRVYRIVVGLIGLLITVGGLVLVPAPGPGWLIVFIGLAVLASEFAWAQRLLHYARRRLDAWTDWMKSQPWWVKGVVSLATLALVLAVVYGYLHWLGPPGLLPDSWAQWLSTTLAL